MKLIGKAIVGLMGASISSVVLAQFQSSPRGANGAGANDLTALTKKGAETAQNFADFAIIIFALIGLVIFGLSLFAMYKAGKDDRESPKGAIVGCLIGGALTAVTVLLGMTGNTFGI